MNFSIFPFLNPCLGARSCFAGNDGLPRFAHNDGC